jgi:hypothetical protein
MKITKPSFLNRWLKGLTLAAVLAAAAAYAGDPTGTWTWTSPGRNGGPDRVSNLTLKVDDTKVTGSISAPGRDGQPVVTPIVDGKLDGDKISFNLVRSYNGNSNTNAYTATVTADAITGKIEFARNGETQSRDWVARLVTDTNATTTASSAPK